MDSQERVENKLDHIADRIGAIDVTIAAQHVSLVEHLRRTEILENTVVPLVIARHRSEGIVKLIGFAAVIAAILEGAMSLLTYLRS